MYIVCVCVCVCVCGRMLLNSLLLLLVESGIVLLGDQAVQGQQSQGAGGCRQDGGVGLALQEPHVVVRVAVAQVAQHGGVQQQVDQDDRVLQFYKARSGHVLGLADEGVQVAAGGGRGVADLRLQVLDSAVLLVVVWVALVFRVGVCASVVVFSTGEKQDGHGDEC